MTDVVARRASLYVVSTVMVLVLLAWVVVDVAPAPLRCGMAVLCIVVVGYGLWLRGTRRLATIGAAGVELARAGLLRWSEIAEIRITRPGARLWRRGRRLEFVPLSGSAGVARGEAHAGHL